MSKFVFSTIRELEVVPEIFDEGYTVTFKGEINKFPLNGEDMLVAVVNLIHDLTTLAEHAFQSDPHGQTRDQIYTALHTLTVDQFRQMLTKQEPESVMQETIVAKYSPRPNMECVVGYQNPAPDAAAPGVPLNVIFTTAK